MRMKMTKGKKVLLGMIFGQVTEFTVIGLAIKANMGNPLLFGVFAGIFITVAVVLGMAACGVDAAEEEQRERRAKEVALLRAQVDSLKRGVK